MNLLCTWWICDLEEFWGVLALNPWNAIFDSPFIFFWFNSLNTQQKFKRTKTSTSGKQNRNSRGKWKKNGRQHSTKSQLFDQQIQRDSVWFGVPMWCVNHRWEYWGCLGDYKLFSLLFSSRLSFEEKIDSGCIDFVFFCGYIWKWHLCRRDFSGDLRHWRGNCSYWNYSYKSNQIQTTRFQNSTIHKRRTWTHLSVQWRVSLFVIFRIGNSVILILILIRIFTFILILLVYFEFQFVSALIVLFCFVLCDDILLNKQSER